MELRLPFSRCDEGKITLSRLDELSIEHRAVNARITEIVSEFFKSPSDAELEALQTERRDLTARAKELRGEMRREYILHGPDGIDIGRLILSGLTPDIRNTQDEPPEAHGLLDS